MAPTHSEESPRCSIRVTVLVENTAPNSSTLGGEHGLAFYVEADGACGLFDTGQTGLAVDNAQALGIDLSHVSWLALSHGHYDHTGGLDAVLDATPEVHVFAHPAAFAPKYKRTADGDWASIGTALSIDEAMGRCGRLHLDKGPVELTTSVRSSGEIRVRLPSEEPLEDFYTDKDGERVRDMFADDQCLILRTAAGVSVLLGCCHAGLASTLSHVREITGVSRLHTVAGGMHLRNATAQRIQSAIDTLRAYHVERIGLAHCTGEVATQAFLEAFGSQCFLCPVGTVVAL